VIDRPLASVPTMVKLSVFWGRGRVVGRCLVTRRGRRRVGERAVAVDHHAALGGRPGTDAVGEQSVVAGRDVSTRLLYAPDVGFVLVPVVATPRSAPTDTVVWTDPPAWPSSTVTTKVSVCVGMPRRLPDTAGT